MELKTVQAFSTLFSTYVSTQLSFDFLFCILNLRHHVAYASML